MTVSRPSLAYVAGTFPLPSETFVYREVRGLRQRGWDVLSVSLNVPLPQPPELADLEQCRLIIYTKQHVVMALGIVAELIRHPWRSMRTFLIAVKDAVTPGERTPVITRLKLPFQALAAIDVANELRALGIQHIHCHFAHAPTTIGMYAAMQMDIPFSFTGHANDLFQRRSILRTKLRRAAFVACISRWHRDWYSSIQPDADGKYEVIRCGVDVGDMERSADSSETLRILTVGRLVEKKGIDTLISAVAELNQRKISARLTIAGDGPDRARLEQIAADLNCRDQITWLGAVPNSRVSSLLGEADVFALPSRQDSNGDRDGIPVVLMEAMAAGIPVIAGDLPTIAELVEEGVSGFLVKPNQPRALADKLAMLWENPALRQRMALEGRKKVESEFSLSLNLDRLERRFIAAQKL
jgi:glycosyltransferase involved in cell wall biosynthesis